jgi:hypothetical protein
MSRQLLKVLTGGAIALLALPARAQVSPGTPTQYRGPGTAFGAPGYFGMGYGVPSFGVPRTYSSFSSPYGGGYSYGYAPYGILPGRYGVGLWRPGVVAPGYVYGASFYRTIPVPYRPLVPMASPPVGMYAPGFGPPAFYSW